MGIHTTTRGKVKFSLALDPDAYELLRQMIAGPRSAGVLVSGLIRAAAERRGTDQDALALHAQRLQVLQEIDRAILSNGSPAEIADATARTLLETTAARRVAVELFDFAAGQRELLSEHGLPLSRPTRDKRPLGDYWLLEENRQGRTGVIPDLAAVAGEDGFRTEMLAAGVRCYTGVPLVVADQVIGAITLGHAELGPLPAGTLKFVRHAADRLALGLHNMRLQEQVLSSRQQLAHSEASLRTLSHRLVELQEEERRNLSRELHDRAGQSMTALKLQLGLLRRSSDCAPSIRDSIDELRAMADGVMTDLHELAVSLRPSSLDRYGLHAALEQLIASFRKQNAIEVDFITTGMYGERLPGDVETALYRIVQEAFTNISRYAEAQRVDVIVSRDADAVSMVVEDDGCGFDVDEALGRGRLGLLGMRERAEMLGGAFAIESEPGGGTVLYVRVPIGPAATDDREAAEPHSSVPLPPAAWEPDPAEKPSAAEAELARAKALGDALNDLYAEIAALRDPDVILERAIMSAGAALACDVATVMAPAGGGWLMRCGYRLPAVFQGRHYTPEECPPYVLYAARTQEVLVVDNCLTDERFTPAQADRFSVHAGMVVPILVAGEVAAALTFAEHSLPRRFTPAEVDFARRLQRSLSLAVENAHLHRSQARQRNELAQRVEELQSLLELLPVGIGIAYDPECRYIKANPALAEMLALSPEDNASSGAHGREGSPGFRVYQDGRELPVDELPMQAAAARGRAVHDVVTEVVRADGTALTLLGNAVPLFDAAGKLRGAIGAFVDVTDQRRAQAEAEEARRTLEALLDCIPEGITIADGPDARIRYVSRYGQILLGGPHQDKTATEVIADWAVYEPDGVTPVAEADLPLVRAIQNGEVVRDRELIQVNAQGRSVSLLCNAGPIRDREERITGGIVAWREVGTLQQDLRLQREEFRRLAAELDAILSSMADGLVVSDRAGRIVRLNATAAAMLGYTPEIQRLPFDQRASVLRPLKADGSSFAPHEYPAMRALHGETVRNEEMILHVPARAGGDMRVSVTSAPIRAQDGTVTGCVTTFTDVGPLQAVTGQLRLANAELLSREATLRAQAGQLKVAADMLEQRVQERTAELEASREQLSQREVTLQALTRRLVELQERERYYVADQLYNEAGQVLAALKMELRLLEQEPECAALASERLAIMKAMVDSTIRELHDLAVHLRPAGLDRVGLVSALRQYVAEFGREHRLYVRCEALNLDGVQLPAVVETGVYRVAQDALANVAQHAHADTVDVVLSRQEDRLVLAIEDDGIGFDPQEAMRQGALGLVAMAERVEALGGSLTVESRPGTGAAIIMDVPLGRGERQA